MKGLKSKYSVTKFILAIIALSGLVALAANKETVGRALNIARPDVKVQISGSVQRDDRTVSFEKAAAVKTGELLEWAITSTNEGTGEARNYHVVGQIPNGTVFVAGSAKGDESPQITYSIDAGKTFSVEPKIEERQPDGAIKMVVAPVSRYTQVMFEWTAPLATQARLNTAYRVRVK